MPDYKKFSLQQTIHCAQEANRTLPGYRPDDTDSINCRAILNKTKTSDNRIYIFQNCVNIAPGSKNQTAALKKRYKDLFGKMPRKNCRIGGCFLGLPKNYIPADYHLTDAEYTALCMYLANQPDIDRKALESGRQKMLSRDFTASEKEQIYVLFEKAIKAICCVFGIKENDILYAVLHMDESFPHLHLVFFPAIYIQDKEAWTAYQTLEKKGDRPRSLLGDTNREIADDESPVGCSIERFDKLFLTRLNINLESAFRKQGIEITIANGKGQINNVQETSTPQREAAAIARGLEEESKRRRKEMDIEFDLEYSKRKVILNQLNGEIRDIKAERDELQDEVTALTTRQNTLQSKIAKCESRLERIKESIKDAKIELNDIQERIHFWIAAGIRKIKKALSKKEKEDAANEAVAALLQIQTDAAITLPLLDDAEDEYDVDEPESERSEKEC